MDATNWMVSGLALLFTLSSAAALTPAHGPKATTPTTPTDTARFDHIVSVVLIMLLGAVLFCASLPHLILCIVKFRIKRRQSGPQPDDVSLHSAYIQL